MNASSRLIHLFLVEEERVGLVLIHAFMIFSLLQHKNKMVSGLEDFHVDIVCCNTFFSYVFSVYVFLRYNLCLMNCPSFNAKSDDVGHCIQCNQCHSHVSSITS